MRNFYVREESNTFGLVIVVVYVKVLGIFDFKFLFYLEIFIILGIGRESVLWFLLNWNFVRAEFGFFYLLLRFGFRIEFVYREVVLKVCLLGFFMVYIYFF